MALTGEGWGQLARAEHRSSQVVHHTSGGGPCLGCDGGSTWGSTRGWQGPPSCARGWVLIHRGAGAQALSWSSLTSAEVGSSKKLHALVAGQQMRAWTRRGVGRVPGDGDRAKTLDEEASGVAGHQDTSLELAEQALGRLLWTRLGKYHLLHSALGAQGLSHKATVQALHLGLPHHVPIVDEGKQQRVVCGQRSASCTSASSQRPTWSARGSGETKRAPCKPSILI